MFIPCQNFTPSQGSSCWIVVQGRQDVVDVRDHDVLALNHTRLTRLIDSSRQNDLAVSPCFNLKQHVNWSDLGVVSKSFRWLGWLGWLGVQWAKQGRCQQPQGALVSIQIVFSANCSSFHSVSLAHSAGLVIRPNSETNNHARLLAPSAARKECRKASAQNLSQAKFHSQRPPSPKLQASNARDEWLYHH
jgi:hypothetical protein